MQNYIKLIIIIFIIISSQILLAETPIKDFSGAKKYLNQNIEYFDYKTLYCSCKVNGKTVDLKSCGYKIQKDAKRAARLEWEHVVPAEAFGNSFEEWRSGSPKCLKKGKKFKGRKCAQTNHEFKKMESDLYNLVPEIGELNALRSNYSMAQLENSDRDFDGCKVKIGERKFEPQDSSKGIVARTYINFENRYPGHGIISGKNKKLFEAWNRMYPLTKSECQRWKKFESLNGYVHLFSKDCSQIK